MGLVLNLLNPFTLVLKSHNVCLGGIEQGRVFPKVKYGKHKNRLGHSTIELFSAFHTFLGKESDCHICQLVGM